MIAPGLRFFARHLVLACLLGVFVAWPGPARAAERQLFILAMNQSGQPIEDLRVDELVFEQSGAECTVKSLEPETDRMKIALLVDNSDAANQSLNSLRDGLRAFLDTLPAQHEVGLFTISGQTRRLVDFTTDRQELTEEVGSIFVQRNTGALVLDGLVETWKRRFEDEDSWPVFVMVLYDGAEASRSVQEREFNEFVNELRFRTATVHAVLLNTGRGIARQTEVSIHITKSTGGIYRALSAATALPEVLAEIATAMGAQYDEVKDRYRAIYECEEESPGARISVRVTRPAVGVRLFADRRTEP